MQAVKVKICRENELREGQPRIARVLARRVAVLLRGDQIYAFEADCKHMKQSLGGGTIEGDIITCPAHGWQYNFITGECLTEAWAALKTFKVSTEDGFVCVEV